MTEHRAGSEQPTLSELDEARDCVTLPAIPTVYGLHHPEDGVTAWVFALPCGKALIVSSREGGLLVRTSLDMVERRWAPLRDADWYWSPPPPPDLRRGQPIRTQRLVPPGISGRPLARLRGPGRRPISKPSGTYAVIMFAHRRNTRRHRPGVREWLAMEIAPASPA